MKLAVIFSLLAALAAADTVHYTYDAAGRLTRADYANGGSIATPTARPETCSTAP
jgi:YD repeat-containing protein